MGWDGMGWMLWYGRGTGYFLRRSLPWDAIHGMDGQARPALL